MKKIIYGFIGILFLTTIWSCAAKKELETPPETVEAVPPAGEFLWVIKPNINIREENSAAAVKIAELADGDSVMVRQNLDGWYKIETVDGKTGWIRSDLLAPRNVSVFRKAVEFADHRCQYRTDLYVQQLMSAWRLRLVT